jgi:lipoprotein-anchoring transpeptidase ErfK/SrfK
MLATQMRGRRPPASRVEIAAEQARMDAAIEQIESEIALADTTARDEPAEYEDDGAADALWIEPERGPIAISSRRGGVLWIVLAVVVAAAGAGGYAFWAKSGHTSAPLVVKSEVPVTTPAPPAPTKTAAATTKDGDLAPGIDGGSSDTDLSYVYRRQPVFYRTLQPVGTVIIDKLQHFLYLIRPNNVALRYGIGVGGRCTDLVGLRKISSMAEWPQWQPPPDMIERKLAKPGNLAGGPGNPLGARVLELDDGKSRINGTNAPKTVGTTVVFGCIRLVNDDIVDLYGRVQVSTPVVFD